MAVKILCDTSVLIPAMMEAHVHHHQTLPLIQEIAAGRLEGAIAAHSLAECFSALTTLKDLPPLIPSEARDLIQKNVRPIFQIIPPTIEDYRKAMDLVIRAPLRGVAVYDALILQAAIRKKITRVITWDTKDFSRLSPSGIRIETPDLSC